MDLRLGWLAASIWISTAVTIAIESRLNPVWVAVWLSVAALAAKFLSKHFRDSKFDFITIAKFTALGILAGVIIATIRVMPIITGPINEASNKSQVVQGLAVVASDPVTSIRRNSLDWSAAEQLRVALTLSQVSIHGKNYKLRLPVTAFASQPSTIKLISNLVPGQEIAVVGKLMPAMPGRATAANLILTQAPTLVGGAPRYQRMASKLRKGLHEALEGTSTQARGLVPGLALGDSSKLEPELSAAMKAAGLTHLIAVSGTNVTLLIVVVLTLLRRSTMPRSYRYVIAGVALAAFVVVVRPQPSVLRATAMGLVALFAGYSGSKKSPLPALCLAVIALVVIDPWLAISYGFALSVAATFGLLLWAKKLFVYLDSRVIKQVPAWVLETLTVTICAQAAVFPLLIALGSPISLVSIPANMIAVPLAGPTMLAGVLAAMLAPVSMPMAHLVAVLAAVPADVIAWVAVNAGTVQWLTVPWPHGLLGVTLALALILNSFLVARKWRSLEVAKQNLVLSIFIPALSLLWIAPTISLSNWPSSDWVMVACDVGQGDAAVIKVGDNSGVVIDVGGDSALIDGCLKRLHIKKIPMLLLTHFHADHVGGLEGALRGREVGQIRISPLADPPETTQFVKTTLSRLGMTSEVMTYPEHFRIAEVDFQCVWPSRLILGEGSDPNNASVALLVTTHGRRILMTGDIEPPAQNAIMQQLGTIQVDVIKIAHHGSRNQSEPFAAWVHAPVALISVGAANDYGHPAPETVSLYEMTGSKVFRTDLQGDLAVLVSGNQVRVATNK